MKLSKTASRFEVGSHSVASYLCSREAMRILLNFGIENVEKRILKLTDHLIEAIKSINLELQTPEEPQYRSGIVNFKIEKPQEVAEKLSRKNIIVSPRANGIRVSPHFYNTEAEIDELFEEIKKTKQS